jgi:DNA-binding CsgD family transcriptional regulator
VTVAGVVAGNQESVALLLRVFFEYDWVTFAEAAECGVSRAETWAGRRAGPVAIGPRRQDLSGAELSRRAITVTEGLTAESEPFRGSGPPSTLIVPLAGPGAQRAAWVLTRGEGDFGPSDLDLARLLAPGLRQRWTLGRLRSSGVTSRELEVLGLVARGLTATTVARRCRISARTVHKHLEHAYGKLGCQDRLTAVLILQDAGLLSA